MRCNFRKRFMPIIVAGCLLPVCNSGSIYPQTANHRDMAGIVNVSAKAFADVEVEIRARDQQLAIRSCKETSEDEPTLCDARMERFDGTKWRIIKPGYPGEVFGIEPDKWKPTIIPPSGSMTLHFKFNPEFYHVRKGERLRLIVDFYTSEESVKKHMPDGDFLSPTFICP